jgi:hypothetical protein
MKTSLFDMNFILPPMIEMTEVVNDMDNGPFFFTASWVDRAFCA